MELFDRVLLILLLVAETGLTAVLDDGQPLILTPLIQNGQIGEARTRSRVPPVLGMDLASYSGFLTVRSEGDANLFFWFFPSLSDAASKPVLLWMNGGPGLTSMSGNFAEIGPYYVTADGQVERRNVTWLSKFNILFVDTPVGAGYSYARSVDFYTNTTTAIAQDLTVALEQFFKLFPEFRTNEFYIAGESYATKYAIVVADMITTTGTSAINFKGLILVSGMFDPVNMIRPAEFLYQVALIDKKLMYQVSAIERVFVVLIRLGLFTWASQLLGLLVGGGGGGEDGAYHPSFFKDISGMVDSDNILHDYASEYFSSYIPLVNDTRVRRALHVGNSQFVEFPPSILAGIIQSGDLAKSNTDQLQDVLNKGYKVLAISGNMDYFIPTAGATDTMDSLVWNGSAEYSQASRTVWRVDANDRDSAGYITCARKFCFAIVRNAGHRLPADEPVRALTVIDRFVNNKPFNVSDGI